MPKRPERCEWCRFWVPYPDDANVTHRNIREDGDNTGHCHRYPPQMDAAFRAQESHSQELEIGDAEEAASGMLGLSSNYEFRWPSTISGDWCGEFQPAPAVGSYWRIMQNQTNGHVYVWSETPTGRRFDCVPSSQIRFPTLAAATEEMGRIRVDGDEPYIVEVEQ